MDFQKIIKNKDVVFGTELVIKGLKTGSLSKVWISSNCPDDVIQSIEHYSKISKVEIVKLETPNDELGTLCKKPFSISVLGVKSG